MLDTFDSATVWRPERPSKGADMETWKDYVDGQLDSLRCREVLGGLVLLPGLQNRIHGGMVFGRIVFPPRYDISVDFGRNPTFIRV